MDEDTAHLIAAAQSLYAMEVPLGDTLAKMATATSQAELLQLCGDAIGQAERANASQTVAHLYLVYEYLGAGASSVS